MDEALNMKYKTDRPRIPFVKKKWDEDIIEGVAKARNLPIDSVRETLQWNVIPIDKLAVICGVGETTIRNAAYLKINRKGEMTCMLTDCIKHPFVKGDKLHIIADEKCESFIRKRI
jgi:hypothetical protein